ncbi:hypothetical protein JZ751_027466 [Albula glossodonta]|uniref:Replication stress response regulator SDE2 n=1 Tax=Albula glossodonta TaxID=121402 RepID=A0A8T2MR01_9TELE|nr:hypothetical protein JZ751_027466 [Albula glossodonta]
MDVPVIDFSLRLCNVHLSVGASVGDLSEAFSRERGIPHSHFYVKSNGKLLGDDEKLHMGGWYRLEPRLCGGKGGFGSMLRALGAQIEKTTNREACRDLSGRRLRDVNHEKEMAEWLKKQADREAEKEQRRMERLQRKLAEPKHYFTDPEYEKQCHEMSERMEESIQKGLQALSSEAAGGSRKRPAPYGADPGKRKCLWMSELDGMSSSEDESEASDGETSPSTSNTSERSSTAQAQGPTETPCSSSSTSPERSSTVQAQGPTETPCSSSSTSPERSSTAQAQGPTETPCSSSSTSPERSSNTAEKTSTVQAQGRTETPCSSSSSTLQRGPGPAAEPEVEAAVQTEAAAPSPSTAVQAEQTTPVDTPTSATVAGPLDLEAVGGVAELEALGLDKLKTELTKRGMKCGGTLQERAARLFSVHGLAKDQIPPALLAKPAKRK